jgi:hypothetical protein
MTKRKTVIGVFHDRNAADQFLNVLAPRGYSYSDVNVMMSDGTRARDYAEHAAAEKQGTRAGNKLGEGAGIGGAVGTAVGATIAAIVAVGTSIVIPGLNLIVAGPLVAALAGGGAGAFAGGVVGALIGLGIPEQDAKAYNEALMRGGVVMSVSVNSDEEASELQSLMTSYGAEQVLCC